VEDDVFDFRKPIDCPWCGHTLTAAGTVFGERSKPEAGDTSMCIECGKFSFFLGTSELRKATYEEFRELVRDPRIMLAWLAWKHTKVERDHDRR
jgi:hypothetical protein